MKLGFHYHIPAKMVGGKVKMPGYLGLFVDSLAVHCEQIVCFQHSPLADECALMDYDIKSENVRLVDIGPHTSVPLRTASAFKKRYIFQKWQNELDCILIRASTPLLPVIASVWYKPIALLLVSDASVGLKNLPQPGWRLALIHLWANWYQTQQYRIAKRSLTFVNSRLLFDQHRKHVSNLVLTQTTTLRERDFFHRENTCTKYPYRLLYTGRMTRIKGLLEMVQALSLLVNKGYDIVLDLVGMLDKRDPVLTELTELSQSLGIQNRVQYHGYKTTGPELLTFYRAADIYLIASQSSSEGFPRTIWEAMASSLPVIATEVGSIPAFIQNAAFLVPPKNVSALTRALEILLTNPELRQDLIHKGMSLAKNNTLEKRANELILNLTHWLETGSIPLTQANSHVGEQCQ